MSLNEERGQFSAYYSPFKLVLALTALLVIAIWPMTAGFSRGLYYTAALYGTGLSVFRIISCVVLLLLSVYVAVILCRTAIGVPAIMVDRGSIVVNGMKSRTIRLSDIESIQEPRHGNAKLVITGQKPVLIPVFLYRGSSAAWAALQIILSKASS
jgi:hypothetical protein